MTNGIGLWCPFTSMNKYDQVGKAEDVSDIITDITPTDTVPFFSMIKSEKVNARVFEWQEDSLAAAANNAQVEGAIYCWYTYSHNHENKQYSNSVKGI